MPESSRNGFEKAVPIERDVLFFVGWCCQGLDVFPLAITGVCREVNFSAVPLPFHNIEYRPSSQLPEAHGGDKGVDAKER